MKGKKLCIGLLIFFTTCLLSLNLSLNANAIDNKTNVSVQNPNSLEWNYYPGVGSSSAIAQNVNFSNFIIGPITLQSDPNRTSTLNNMKINLRNSITLSNNRYFHFKIYFLVKMGDTGSYDLSVPLCPIGQSPYVIDNCQITHIVDESEIFRIREQLLDPSDNFDYSSVQYDSNYYYVMEFTGHYASDSNTTITSLNFRNHFYVLYNTAPLGYIESTIYLYFTPIEVFEYSQSAEDEAAEKELEDRDNLESQSTSTDQQANTATQSAENTGTTLFAAFTQFFNALTNVSGSSCILPTMQVYSLDLGQMDLCTFDIPPQIMALVSIGMVFIIVPLGVHLVKKMISLYKEITG